MSSAKRSYLSLHPALESIRVYREQLRDYSSDELEDIYFHIDVLREPVRYRLVQMEMERRGLHPEPDETGPVRGPWVDRVPGFANIRGARSVYLGALLFLATGAVMAAILVPMWLFAVPLHFSGVQASIVYLILLPLSVPVGVAFGLRAGGWRTRTWAAPAAILLSLWLFYASGGVAAIIKPLFQVGGGGGGLFSGF